MPNGDSIQQSMDPTLLLKLVEALQAIATMQPQLETLAKETVEIHETLSKIDALLTELRDRVLVLEINDKARQEAEKEEKEMKKGETALQVQKDTTRENSKMAFLTAIIAAIVSFLTQGIKW